MMNQIPLFFRKYTHDYPQIAQFIRYVIAGGTSAFLELLVFMLLIHDNLWYVFANALAFVCAAVYGFFIQKFWTFQNNEKTYIQHAIKFLIVISFGFILTNFWLFLFIHILHWQAVISKIVQLWLVMISNYAGQRFFTFRERKM